MGKSFSNDDHDPGDEDPTERVKRALLEVLEEERNEDHRRILQAEIDHVVETFGYEAIGGWFKESR